MRPEHSRRRFLIQAAGLLAAPAVLVSCRGQSTAASRRADADHDIDVDDIDESGVARPALPTVEPTIRVRVARVRGPSPAAMRIGQENQWLRMKRDNNAGQGVALYGPIIVKMESSGWSVTDAKGFRAEAAGREALEVAVLADEPSWIMNLEELSVSAADAVAAASSQPEAASQPSTASTGPNIKKYPGTLRLVWRRDLESKSPGSYDVVNDVPLESYLPGVLAGELYRTWQLETFAAQAIAARSFASTEVAVFAGRRHYDVSNTTASQMYLGVVSEGRARDAVLMTRGLVLGFENLLVSGYYSSCCGGTAASAADAIGDNAVNDVPPLQGRSGSDACTEAPVYQWKVQHTIDLLTRRIVAFGQQHRTKDLMNLSRLASIDAVATNANGRPTRLRLTDERDGTAEMTAENFRRAANYSGQGLSPPDKPLRSSNFKASFTRNLATFDGYGYGHGVGLCQYGAEALAKSGTKHRDIVLWYYPGADLVQAYR